MTPKCYAMFVCTIIITVAATQIFQTAKKARRKL
jgi:hypothetical protein